MSERLATEGRPPSGPSTRRRLAAALLLAVVLGSGLAVHSFAADSAASDIAGDALYATLIYLLGVLIAPRRSPWVVGAVAVAWCTAVELFQLTGLPQQWGARFAPAVLVFGTVFDARDIAIYAATIAVCALLDAVLAAVRRGLPRGTED